MIGKPKVIHSTLLRKIVINKSDIFEEKQIAKKCNNLFINIGPNMADDIFTIESLKINANISTIKQEMNLNLLTQREMNYKDHTKFFRLILQLSGDINLNPGPTQIPETWSVFKKGVVHFVHLNINSLPSKIEELRLDSEVSIPNYSLIRKDRSRKGGAVACYMRNDICFNSQNYLSDETENISFDLLLPKTKPISIAIVH